MPVIENSLYAIINISIGIFIVNRS